MALLKYNFKMLRLLRQSFFTSSQHRTPIDNQASMTIFDNFLTKRLQKERAAKRYIILIF